MWEDQGSFKTLEDVYLKATYNMKLNGRSFEEGETIATFDKISVSGLTQLREFVAARGGYDNRAHVLWETTRELKLTFSQGVFSNTQFALLNNAHTIKLEEDEPILITKVEQLESNEVGQIFTEKEPIDQIFVYDLETGNRLFTWKVATYLKIEYSYKNVLVSYRYNYTGGASIAKIGQPALSGFLSLEGKTRVKDDTSGLITTGIIKIPKLKLMSGLSIKMGTQVNPVVGNFEAVGVPVESRHSSYVLEFDFLNNDIDSDM